MYNLERFFPKCLTQSAFKNFKNTFYGQDLKKKKTPSEWLYFDDDVLSSTLISQCDMNYV